MRESLIRKRSAVIVFVFVLWLVTAAVGLWEIFIVRELLLRLFVHFIPYGVSNYTAFKQAQMAGTVSNFLVFPLALLWIGAIIGAAEYHRTRIGRPESWQLFGRTVAVELSILLLVLFI